jgi:uncharacterized OB-fold protein
MSEPIEAPFTAESFKKFLQQKQLMASRCTSCDGLYLPPRAICPGCHSDQMRWEALSGKGRLAAFTAVHIAPTFMTELGYGRGNPYIAGVVDLEEGMKMSARILNLDATKPENIQLEIPLEVEYLETEKGITLAFKPE